MPEIREMKVGAEGFEASEVNLVRLRKARQAWTSFVLSSKGVIRDLV